MLNTRCELTVADVLIFVVSVVAILVTITDQDVRHALLFVTSALELTLRTMSP